MSKNQRLITNLVIWILVAVLFCLAYYFVVPGLWAIVRFLIPLFTPFIIAVVVAALIDPAVWRLQNLLKVPRGVAVLLVIGGLLAAIIGFTVYITSELIAELSRFSRYFPAYSEQVSQSVLQIFTRLENFFAGISLPAEVVEAINQLTNRLLTWLGQFTADALNAVLGFATFLPTAFLIFTFSLIATFFFSRDARLIQKWLSHLIPASWVEATVDLGGEVYRALVGFVRAQAMLILLTMIITWVGLAVLGIPFAASMTVVVGIADLLPIIGPGTIFMPWAAIVLIQGNIRLCISLLVLYGIISVVRQILQPKVLGDQLGLHPLEALVAIYAGLMAIGFWGLIIGPLVVVVIKAMWRAGLLPRPGDRR